MRKKYLTIPFILIYFLSFSQTNFNLEKVYRDYFDLPRESMFIHTNKTTYLTGENIWFKVYVYDKLNKKPSIETKNIYVGIFDSKGNQVSKKLYLAKNGATDNSIKIDSSFSSGFYFLKANTKWMNNFREDDSFVQKIQILNPQKNSTQKAKISSKEFDIQFLPEGGHLVNNIKNTLGIKILDDKGAGTSASGAIYNSKGEQITNFKTNFLGIGKLSFTPFKKEIYTAKITLQNSKEITIPISDIKEKGINISVDNFRKDKTVISLRTNDITLKEINKKNYTLLIHQNGASSSIPISFDKKIQRISIPKEKLNNGVNIVTLFDGKTPILERMFFNLKETIASNFSINKIKKTQDSVFYNLNTNIKEDKLINISVSLLPKETKSYNPKHNILSSFLLKPYLKGEIENPQYYFNKPSDKKRAYHLDNLLITQGWSRYNWNTIFYNIPKIKFPFEKGIKITGKLNQKQKKIHSLMLFPSKLNNSKLLEVSKNDEFVINNFFPESNEILRFTSFKKSGKGQRPRMYVSIPNIIKKETIDIDYNEEYSSYYSNKNEVVPLNFVRDRVEQLDEIVLESRLDIVFKKRGAKFNGSIIKIDDNKAKTYNTIADILETEKFIVQRGTNGTSKCRRGDCSNEGEDPRPDLNIVSREKNSAGFPRPVFFYVEGAIVQNLNRFLMSGTLEYEDVYIDYSNNLVSSGRSFVREAIVVNLFLRRTAFKSADLNNHRHASVEVKHGFEPKKEFYAPGYISYRSKPFKNYGIVHWEPNVNLANNNEYNIKAVNTGLDEISFFIEGMSSTGKLFSQVIHLNKKIKKASN